MKWSALTASPAILALSALLVHANNARLSRVAPESVATWTPAQLLGCYEIFDAKGQRAESAWYNVMPFVRLTDVPFPTSDPNAQPRSWHVRPLSNAGMGRWKADPTGALERVSRFVPMWTLNARSDSLTFVFRDGFSGASIHFAERDAAGDTLRGHVIEHWDAGPTDNARGSAYAVRQVCP